MQFWMIANRGYLDFPVNAVLIVSAVLVWTVVTFAPRSPRVVALGGSAEEVTHNW